MAANDITTYTTHEPATHSPVHQDIRYDGDDSERDEETNPAMFGPGFRSHPHHQATHVQYILVTPEMMEQMQHGHAAMPHTITPATTIGPSTGDFSSPKTAQHKFGNSVEHFEHAPPTPAPQEEVTPFKVAANPLARFRHEYKDYLGEFIGTMILIIFGNGINCQAVLTDFTQGQYLSISFGWGIGVMFGVYAAGGVSGAHINPAVTIGLATFRGFPWRKVPGYALAQTLGACLGSCLIQGNYHALLNQFEGGYNVRTYGLETSTGALFFTDSKPYMSLVGGVFSEVLATAVLLCLILCLSDQANNPAPPGLNGLILCFLIIGIGAALGTETAYCLNPARDLGPRIACAMFGYPSTIWTYKRCYWIHTAIAGTTLGAVIGAFVYDLFIFSGPESPLNRPWRSRTKSSKPNV